MPRFDEYAYEQHIENEFDFWKDAIAFQKEKFKSPRKAKEAARVIYHRYLEKGSPREIFLHEIVLIRIRNDLKKKYIASIYQDAILEISHLLSQHFRIFTTKYNLKTDFTVFNEQPVLVLLGSMQLRRG